MARRLLLLACLSQPVPRLFPPSPQRRSFGSAAGRFSSLQVEEAAMGSGSLVKTPRLSRRQRDDVEALAAACRQHEELEVPLHLEPAAGPGAESSQFLY